MFFSVLPPLAILSQLKYLLKVCDRLTISAQLAVDNSLVIVDIFSLRFPLQGLIIVSDRFAVLALIGVSNSPTKVSISVVRLDKINAMTAAVRVKLFSRNVFQLLVEPLRSLMSQYRRYSGVQLLQLSSTVYCKIPAI